MSKKTREDFNRTTPCCGYVWNAQDEIMDGEDAKGPIYWNPFNNAVQCHNCGHRFYTQEYGPTAIEYGMIFALVSIAAIAVMQFWV